MDAYVKPILHLPKWTPPPPPRARKVSPHAAFEAARAAGPHAGLIGEELIAKEKQCHAWFLMIMRDFVRLHEAAERQDAKHFVWEKRFQIKKSF